MRDINAGCFQFEIESGNVDANLEKVEKALEKFAKLECELVVLPEMWPSGFDYPRLKDHAARAPEILERLRARARELKMVIVGAIPELEGDAVYNTSYAIDADGGVAGAYHKVHLFTANNEHLHFARGDRAVIADTAVGKLGLLTCYDVRFPELARRLALDGAEIICLSALWPTTRTEHWTLLSRARALENQIYLLACNGCGMDKNLSIGGHSQIVAPTGFAMAAAQDEETGITALLEADKMAAFRERLPCFSDRLPEAY